MLMFFGSYVFRFLESSMAHFGCFRFLAATLYRFKFVILCLSPLEQRPGNRLNDLRWWMLVTSVVCFVWYGLTSC
ncbi:hypothetical protein ERO13_A04G026400v2 [Gossypium hirsutum]|uniref:Uncharacterized protein n=2 Tax=Gossypium TaxID=3633 RepID=A0A5D2QU38_GOSTO|nr:hypothetical protein ERO13_A04G026400v2 [Gossypium hirsutum]TYH21311.1 hypothetical protein ES288_A04G033700v1 [Gossypium darwinii]TYI32097.1 hypothetical protein ES332_A04G034300v1 [Gossypium tomentosum]